MPSEGTVHVTGGAGFVGVNVVATLARAGHAVVSIDRIEPPQRALRSPWSQRVDWRRAVLDDLPEAGPVSTVIHLAAITADAARERSEAARIVGVNVAGTQHVLDWARRHGASRIVYGSSGAVYGAAAFGTAPIDETTACHPTTLYGATKLAGEHLTLRHAELWETEAVVVRLGPLYGPWERATGVRDTLSPFLAVARLAASGGHHRIPATAPRAWTYVRHAATCITRLATGPAPGHDRYLVASPEPIVLEEWAAHLAATRPSFTFETGPGSAVPYDGDPQASRARLDVGRIVDELGGWPGTPHEGFTDYASWLSGEPTTSASSATTP